MDKLALLPLLKLDPDPPDIEDAYVAVLAVDAHRSSADTLLTLLAAECKLRKSRDRRIDSDAPCCAWRASKLDERSKADLWPCSAWCACGLCNKRRGLCMDGTSQTR